MRYRDKRIRDYLNCLAAKTPVPGGGSQSALVGALGCGLLCMVAHFTLADKGLNGYKERVKRALKKSIHLMEKLTLLVDKDAQAYQKLSYAFKKYPKNTPGFQKALKQAIMPPAQVCDSSYKAALVALELSYVGKRVILSDVESAIHNLDAAFGSGLANINVNLGYIQNKSYALLKIQKYKVLQVNIKQVKNKVLSVTRERMNS